MIIYIEYIEYIEYNSRCGDFSLDTSADEFGMKSSRPDDIRKHHCNSLIGIIFIPGSVDQCVLQWQQVSVLKV